MTNEKRKVYVKFEIDNKMDMMRAMLLSEDLNAVNKWKGHKKEKERTNKRIEMESATNRFQAVAQDFEKSIEVFQTSVPYIMQITPILREVSDDRSIRGYVKKHGVLLDSTEYELYEMNIDQIAGLNRKMEEATAIRAGINSLPRLFILGLISAYDAFLSRLIRAILVTKPEILSSSERNISFKELVEIGSVEAVRDGIIEKEVETVIRSSHADQIEWLEKKLGMTLKKDLKIWPHFIEICERRNLFTHTDGVVSSQYLKVCGDHGYKPTDELGTTLSVNPKYYEESVSIILEMGSKLTQVVWRKLCPSEIDIASSELNEFAYRLITKRKYKTAATMLDFGLHTIKKQGSDAIKKRMVVNYANALKLDGNLAKANKILDNEDWTSSTDAYRICVAAVKDDIDAVIRMMKAVIDAKLLRIVDLREWPVFENVRADTKFIEAFEQIFGEKLVTNREAVSPSKSESAQDTDGEPKSSDKTVAPDERSLH